MTGETILLIGATMFNGLLVTAVGFLIKHELHDVKTRIVRMENFMFLKKG